MIESGSESVGGLGVGLGTNLSVRLCTTANTYLNQGFC